MKELLTRKGMVWKISVILLLSGYCIFAINFTNAKLSDESNRRLQTDVDCKIRPTENVEESDTSVFISSFPGSGARMTWKLVEAITRKRTGDEWNSNGLGKNVIGVNTHWPHPTHGHKLAWGEEIDKAIIFIRNPMDVLSEFHNYIYSATVASTDQGQTANKVAPEAAWLKWRDANFNQQLYLWRVHTQYWLDKYKPENRIVTPFERLVDYRDGPKFANEINQFLGRKKNENNILSDEGLATPNKGLIADDKEVTCMWQKILDEEDSELEKYVPRVDRTAEARALIRSAEESKETTRPFTKEQYNQLVVILRNLRVKYGNEPRMDNTLRMYDKAVKKARDNQILNDLFIH